MPSTDCPTMLSILKRRNVSEEAAANSQIDANTEVANDSETAASNGQAAIDNNAATTYCQTATESEAIVVNSEADTENRTEDTNNSQAATETKSTSNEDIKQTNKVADSQDKHESRKTVDEDDLIIKEEPKSPAFSEVEDHDFLNSELRIVLPCDDIKQEAMDATNTEIPYESTVKVVDCADAIKMETLDTNDVVVPKSEPISVHDIKNELEDDCGGRTSVPGSSCGNHNSFIRLIPECQEDRDIDNVTESSTLDDNDDEEMTGDKSGEKKRRKPVPLTTMCPICGNPAPGHNHFGGMCCYSCRAFFRRTSTRPLSSFKCRGGENNCVVTAGSKCCIRCRLRKCLQVGMDPTLIKGRRMGRQMNPIWEDANMGHHQPPPHHPPQHSLQQQHPHHSHQNSSEQVQKENRPVMSVIRASGSAAAAWSTSGVIPVPESRAMTMVPTTTQQHQHHRLPTTHHIPKPPPLINKYSSQHLSPGRRQNVLPDHHRHQQQLPSPPQQQVSSQQVTSHPSRPPPKGIAISILNRSNDLYTSGFLERERECNNEVYEIDQTISTPQLQVADRRSRQSHHQTQFVTLSSQTELARLLRNSLDGYQQGGQEDGGRMPTLIPLHKSREDYKTRPQIHHLPPSPRPTPPLLSPNMQAISRHRSEPRSSVSPTAYEYTSYQHSSASPPPNSLEDEDMDMEDRPLDLSVSTTGPGLSRQRLQSVISHTQKTGLPRLFFKSKV